MKQLPFNKKKFSEELNSAIASNLQRRKYLNMETPSPTDSSLIYQLIDTPVEMKPNDSATTNKAVVKTKYPTISYATANKVELIHLGINSNKANTLKSTTVAQNSKFPVSISSSSSLSSTNDDRSDQASTYTSSSRHSSKSNELSLGTWRSSTNISETCKPISVVSAKYQQRLAEEQKEVEKNFDTLLRAKTSPKSNTLWTSNIDLTRSLIESLPLDNVKINKTSTTPTAAVVAAQASTIEATKLALEAASISYPYFEGHRQSSIMNSPTGSAASTSSSANNSMSTYSLVDPNKIHLFVKGGQDGRSQGACPFCQNVFLQLLVKAQTNQFNFDVITINLENPPKEFKELSIKPPVLVHGRTSLLDDQLQGDTSGDESTASSGAATNFDAVILSDVDEIAEYLDRIYPNSKLSVNNASAKKVCLNVFSKFSFFIRDIASKSTYLEAELEKIDNYLRDNCLSDNENEAERKVLFLDGGSTLTALDTALLPKLQHIRIAAESVKKFRIPKKYQYLWRYIKNAYETDAFQKSCPPDREIIWHWSKTILSHKDLLLIMQEYPYRTLSVPDDIFSNNS